MYVSANWHVKTSVWTAFILPRLFSPTKIRSLSIDLCFGLHIRTLAFSGRLPSVSLAQTMKYTQLLCWLGQIWRKIFSDRRQVTITLFLLGLEIYLGWQFSLILLCKVFNKLAFLTCQARFQFSVTQHSLRCSPSMLLHLHVHQPAKKAGILWAMGSVHVDRCSQDDTVRYSPWCVPGEPAPFFLGHKKAKSQSGLRIIPSNWDLKILLCAVPKTDFCSAHVHKILCASCCLEGIPVLCWRWSQNWDSLVGK